MTPKPGNYIVVSPVKDEQAYVERTLRSVVQQTLLPLLWVIVDDGSTDATPHILQSYVSQYPWIRVIRLSRDKKRDLGVAEVRAFLEGYDQAKGTPHEFVVKLDCDVELPPGYFESLLKEFDSDPRLGIASGAYVEERGGQWLISAQPPYHACGASKIVRVQCFRDIEGFIVQRGWDTVDEIKAQMHGWKTAHFPEIVFRHLKAEGSAAGSWETNVFHGDIYYRTGGGISFFLLKVLRRAVVGRPWLLGGVLMLFGYMKAAVLRVPRAVSKAEARFYRKMLNQRMRQSLKRKLGLRSYTPAWNNN